MNIKLAGSEISNFRSHFALGQSVEAEVKGYINDLRDAYEIIIDGKRTNDPYFPVCNGVDDEANKYLICTRGKDLSKLYAFESKNAYVGG